MTITSTGTAFQSGIWTDEIDVRDFIQRNYTPYEGDSSFLEGPSGRTRELWAGVTALLATEREHGVLDADTSVISSIVSHPPGYIDRDNEVIVGLQTDEPLKRALMPFGGIRMAEKSLRAHGFEIDPGVKEIFETYRKTHNQGVFDVYNEEMRAARHSGIITGVPDAYGRGRIIGD